jgi:AcrR family transcriptional regulator
MTALPAEPPTQAQDAGVDDVVTRPSRRYHHGDLASALMDAGEAELAEKGTEAFSLRGVAKRAGVSHAAPAHHFGDARGLLTAIAARGFERFVARQQDFRSGATPDPRTQLEASGVGYVAFAMEHPALFRLMFGSDRPDFTATSLDKAACAAFDDLVHHVAAVTGQHADSPQDNPELMSDVAATWAVAHGLADLLAAGRLPSLATLPPQERARAIVGIVGRVLRPA